MPAFRSNVDSRHASPGLAAVVAALVTGLGARGVARADVDPVSGIDFVTVGAVGNAPYRSDYPNDYTSGRGGVNYEYRIGRMEVTTGQWAEFFNAAYDRPRADWIPFVDFTTFWGAVSTTPTAPGGARWRVPAGNELRPVGDISWRTAAIYCNWLHNGKSSAREAFLTGAYDVSTFGDLFTEAPTHMPGARYWIPTFDEQLKAFHYDPDKPNSDGTLGGWWRYSNGSDAPYVYGPPGVLVNGRPAQANAGWDNRDYPLSPFSIPLGSYPTVQTPWGLLDAAGGTGEWTETKYLETQRRYNGSFWSLSPGQSDLIDRVDIAGSDFPYIPTLEHGLRVASVPGPGTLALGLGACITVGVKRRRRHACDQDHRLHAVHAIDERWRVAQAAKCRACTSLRHAKTATPRLAGCGGRGGALSRAIGESKEGSRPGARRVGIGRSKEKKGGASPSVAMRRV